MSPNDLLSTSEVATLCRVSESTVRHWRHHSEGPLGFRVGRRVRYRRSDVDAWLEAQRATTGVGARIA